MQRDRGAEIKNIRDQNKKLQEDTQKMILQLEKIKLLKQQQLLKMQKKEEQLLTNQLAAQTAENKPASTKPKSNKLSNYGAQITKTTADRLKNKKFKVELPDSSSQSDKDNYDESGENLRYFLQVMGMDKYFPAFQANKILTLPKLRNLKQEQLKEMNVPIKDHVKIIKKIREMGY